MATATRKRHHAAMCITPEKRHEKEVTRDFDARLAAVLIKREEHERMRSAVMKALTGANKYWSCERMLRLDREASRQVSTFLNRVNDALKQFAVDPEKQDTGLGVLIPFQTTRELLIAIGIRSVGDFLRIELPMLEVLMTEVRPPLSEFIARMHPKYPA